MDKHTIRNATDGSVDIAASVNTYAAKLSKWVSENEIPVVEIESAIDSVFDNAESNKTIPKPALIGYATNILNPDHTKLASAQARIDAFLKGSSRFYSIKGTGGGVRRICKIGEEESNNASLEEVV